METFVTGRIQPVQMTLRTKRFSPVGQNTILAFRSQLMEKYPCRYKFNGQQRYCSYSLPSGLSVSACEAII